MSSSPCRAHICGIVPPHLLEAIASSNENSETHRNHAQRTLSISNAIVAKRAEVFQSLSLPRGYAHTIARPRQNIVPDHLLQAIIDSHDTDDDLKACAQRDLEHIRSVHASYQATQQGVAPGSSAEQGQRTMAAAAARPKKGTTPATTYRAIYDAKHDSDENDLPGERVRIEGQAPTKDKNVDDAYDYCGKVLEFYLKFFNWNSIDNKGMHVTSSCHFAQDYENAYWDPEKMQMVYGDGSTFLYNFTGCPDVIAHEMTHAITEHTSPLDYQDQAGALNESVSDVFGIMCKQYIEQETSDKADWLIGEGCIMPGVKGVALRSMKAPGTAYNDPRFGKDPQPDNMSGYKVTTQDNGGVHIYSGIPNKAFYGFSVAMGGFSYEKAGQVWWKTMTSGRIPPKCTFLQFADVTVDMAEEMYGEDAGDKCRAAWDAVGVTKKRKTGPTTGHTIPGQPAPGTSSGGAHAA